MNRKKIFNELVKAYENNDVESFEKINEENDLGLTSIDQIEEVQDVPTFDLSKYYVDYQAIYYKNYITSRYILNMEPLPKYKLKEPEINIISYSYMIFHVLTGLQENPVLDEVLDDVELQFSSQDAKEILISKDFIQVNDIGEAIITPYGIYRLRGVNWVGFYDSFLDYFDFDDFERYMKEYDTGDVFQNSLNYLDEHLKIAIENKEFNRLHDVFSSKAMVYMNKSEFKNALMEELKIFVLKLNPIYLDDLESYQAVGFPNINNITEFNDLAEVKSLKRVLYKVWMDFEFDEMLMTKKEAFNYLTRAIDGEYLDKLSEEIANKHFK